MEEDKYLEQNLDKSNEKLHISDVRHSYQDVEKWCNENGYYMGTYWFPNRCKLNIHDFIEQLSIDDIRKSIEDNLHYKKTGKRLFDRTIQDEIYEIYFSGLGESKSTMMFESYDIICRELSKRWFLGNV